MIDTILRYLKTNLTTSIIWLATILAWILYLCGVNKTGQWLLVCAITIFVLIMIIGQLKDKIKDLQEQLDRYKI